MPGETLRILLNGLIDYAGLFPPASLDMPAALRNYAAYRKGEYAWMLGRFVVPAARVNEVDTSWPVSVLYTEPRRMEVAGAVTYYEVTVDSDLDLPNGAYAKIRMGGETFPEPVAVARFLRARVPFKATAGLHHPLRNPPAHGFVNLFLAAALAWRGQEPLPTLEEQSAGAFVFGDETVEWHGHAVSADVLREVRQRFAISFGSCSFEEPIAGLKGLGWL
ncbi:MAG TPA: hypothetical protein VMJ75_02880 [Candidatus Acidoferrales bacterium]|nr:hypothetical protein [Candidatus Acidoferrales bacterium]